jgi:hypothetical protein
MRGVPAKVQSEIVDLADRLEREYAGAFHKMNGNIGTYINRTSLNVEVLFGKGRLGRMTSGAARTCRK